MLFPCLLCAAGRVMKRRYQASELHDYPLWVLSGRESHYDVSCFSSGLTV